MKCEKLCEAVSEIDLKYIDAVLEYDELLKVKNKNKTLRYYGLFTAAVLCIVLVLTVFSVLRGKDDSITPSNEDITNSDTLPNGNDVYLGDVTSPEVYAVIKIKEISPDTISGRIYLRDHTYITQSYTKVIAEYVYLSEYVTEVEIDHTTKEKIQFNLRESSELYLPTGMLEELLKYEQIFIKPEVKFIEQKLRITISHKDGRFEYLPFVDGTIQSTATIGPDPFNKEEQYFDIYRYNGASKYYKKKNAVLKDGMTVEDIAEFFDIWKDKYPHS